MIRASFSLVSLFLFFSTIVIGDSSDNSLSSSESISNSKKYYVGDIKKAMTDHIANEIDEDGIFRIRDEKTGEILTLRFVKIHDPVRVINSNTYFACTDFHVVGNPKKLYDLDFWMHPESGELKIFKSKIHKEPRKSIIYGWYKQPRYTFVDDKVVPLY
ncbi:MAG: hypothetical protein R8G33_03285 [Gammaproteobacteria bacterium]|nr:hypothetical protein [Gammaproteobacteria bacterium]